MLSMRSLAAAGALTVLPQLVFAAEAGKCVDVSVPKKAVEAQKGKWIELTPDQWEFLRGISCDPPTRPRPSPMATRRRSPGSTVGGMVSFLSERRRVLHSDGCA